MFAFLPIAPLRASRHHSLGARPHRVRRTPHAALVGLTREVGKNGKLAKALEQLSSLSTTELPCVATVAQPGVRELRDAIEAAQGWLVVSSPESARVVVEHWSEKSEAHVAAIGGGTAQVLREAGLRVEFEPSKATFRTLASELPAERYATVLYPASLKASTENVQALIERGFIVRRLNTYSTETAVWTEIQRELGARIDVVTFASPTTVKGWVANMGVCESLPVACIGETSGSAAKRAGFRYVFHPHLPGVSGWVDAIRDALVCCTDGGRGAE